MLGLGATARTASEGTPGEGGWSGEEHGGERRPRDRGRRAHQPRCVLRTKTKQKNPAMARQMHCGRWEASAGKELE